MSQNLNITSQITFLYYQDFEKAKSFFADTLGLELVLDVDWACLYRTSDTSYVGAVDKSSGSIDAEQKGGVLISITVEDASAWRQHLIGKGLEVSNIKEFDFGLRSFLFKDPEGYDFEIQEFTKPEIRIIF